MGMLNVLVEKSNVFEISSALVLGMYDLWHLYCSMAGTMYQPNSPCGAHDALLFGILWVTPLVPVGYSGVGL